MKIGIITYHFARNYGAILQCYALQRYLRSMGHDAVVLDYETERQKRNNSLHHKRDNPAANLAVNVALLPFERQRRLKEARYVDFESREIARSPRLRTLQELASYVNGSGFDLLISGSDQVFNPRIADFDPAFVFPFETTARKGSFAASLGSSTDADISPLAENLSVFDVLCVREKSDVPVIERVCGRTPHVVDDPVFLLGKGEWSSVAAKSDEPDDYVLGYYINKEASPRYLELTEAVAGRLGLPLRVINVRFGRDSFRREMVTDAGPAEFLSLFERASFVCTDSFHGTAFSLIFGKPFVSFEPKASSSDWRKRDLLEKVGEPWRSVAVDRNSARDDVLALADGTAPAVESALLEICKSQDSFLRFMTEGERL